MAEIIGIHAARDRRSTARPEPLWREALGQALRDRRDEKGLTLARTAARAGISPQYLSEIERGRKEPSSEMIAAIAGALDTSLTQLTRAVTDGLHTVQQIPRVTNSVLLAA
ncbi:XRE family transcriptional regulator [Nakamurella silvestris]|nr:XRE family transcriptional regulator [Nakamurella silvestris]